MNVEAAVAIETYIFMSNLELYAAFEMEDRLVMFVKEKE